MAITNTQGNFTKAGAFGGSREGVADGLTNESYLRQAGDLSAQLRSQGFDKASALAEGEVQRGQAAEGQNQQRDLSLGTQNAGYRQQANLANAEATNARDQFNANLAGQVNLANTEAR